MAKRKIQVGGMTFRRAQAPADVKLWGFALFAETVDVHKDDLDRFDRLNGPAVTEQPPLPESFSEDPEEEALGALSEPPRSGKGSGVGTWTAYAESLGVDVPEDATRDDVIALVDLRD